MMMEKFMTLLHCTRMHRTQHIYYFAFDLFICYAVCGPLSLLYCQDE